MIRINLLVIAVLSTTIGVADESTTKGEFGAIVAVPANAPTGVRYATNVSPDKSPKQLSVEPFSSKPFAEYKYPDDRPEWVSRTPELDGKVHHWPVFSIPSSSPEAAHDDMLLQARAAVRRYVSTELGVLETGIADKLPMSESWLDEHLIDPAKVYRGNVETPEGMFYEEAAELVFTPKFHKLLDQVRDSNTLTERMHSLVALTLMSFVGLASLSTLLKLVSVKKS